MQPSPQEHRPEQDIGELAVQVFCLPYFLDKCKGWLVRRSLKAVCKATRHAVDSSFKSLGANYIDEKNTEFKKIKPHSLYSIASKEEYSVQLMEAFQALRTMLQRDNVIIESFSMTYLHNWPQFLPQLFETGICNHLRHLELKGRETSDDYNGYYVSALQNQQFPVLQSLTLHFNGLTPIDLAPLCDKQFCKQLKVLTLHASNNTSAIDGTSRFLESCQHLNSLCINFRCAFKLLPLMHRDYARAIVSLKELRSLMVHIDKVSSEAWDELLNADWVDMKNIELGLHHLLFERTDGSILCTAKWSLQPGARLHLHGFKFTISAFSKLVVAPWFANIGKLSLDHICWESSRTLSLLADVSMPYLTRLHLDSPDDRCSGAVLVALANASGGNLASLVELNLKAQATESDLRAFARGEWKNLRSVMLPEYIEEVGFVHNDTYFSKLLMSEKPDKWKAWNFGFNGRHARLSSSSVRRH